VNDIDLLRPVACDLGTGASSFTVSRTSLTVALSTTVLVG